MESNGTRLVVYALLVLAALCAIAVTVGSSLN